MERQGPRWIPRAESFQILVVGESYRTWLYVHELDKINFNCHIRGKLSFIQSSESQYTRVYNDKILS